MGYTIGEPWPGQHQNRDIQGGNGSMQTSASPCVEEDGPFCDTCRHNQLLVMKLIASYDGPQEEMDKYRMQMEEMYPLVCRQCLPRVDKTLKMNDYNAKAKILGSWLDSAGVNSKAPTTGTTTSPSILRFILWYIRGIAWWICAIGSIALYLLGCLKGHQQLFTSAVLDQTNSFEYNNLVRTLYLFISLVLQLDTGNSGTAGSLSFNGACLLIQVLRILIPWSFLFSLWDYRWHEAVLINSRRRIVRRVKGRAEYAVIQLVNYLVRLSSIRVIPYICRQAVAQDNGDYYADLLRTCCLVYLVVSIVGVVSALRCLHLDIVRLPNMSTVPSVSLGPEEAIEHDNGISQHVVPQSHEVYVKEIQMQDAPEEPPPMSMKRQRFFPPPPRQAPDDAKLEHLFTSVLDLGNPTSVTTTTGTQSTSAAPGTFSRLISKVKNKLQ